MQLNIACGKGAKQRLVPLSPRLLETLREYWKQYRPTTYLFPGKTPDKPYAATSIQKAIKASAALLVLHTWNQKLGAHAHVHALVPGAGPALDGSALRRSQRAGDPSSVGTYLVDAAALRAAFRKKFLRGLKRLRAEGKLRFAGRFADLQCDDPWREFLTKLEAVD